ncbi:peptidase S8/S53 domain-containing protein [Diplogelasinospora grovesii]|uniref:Peptidase S8/S53 domain-containing protein n=1 Tax=Diplogelasinospora grovesii TaxID=303347 RepID=A0AAN6NAY8_9PEZI|nr:peptidase S8/S53 domain-containing protein [Diplogelasinospora grovesii]
MSLNDIFAPAYGDVKLSASLKRRLRLLQAVLPHFTSAAAHMYLSARKYSPARAFWTNFLSPCIAMESATWGFQKLDDQHERLVSRLLECLEKLVSMDKPATMAEEFTSSAFPKLETLRKCVNDSLSDAEELLSGRWKIVKPTDQQECGDLVKLLDELAKAVKDDSKQPPPEESSHVISGSKSSLAPVLRGLFSTISNYCRCKCANPHRAMLLLFTHRSLPKNTGSHSFTMLLSRGNPRKGSTWQEMGVAIEEQAHKPKVRIILPEESIITDRDQGLRNESLVRVTDLCATMDNITSRLNLNIDGKSLFQLAETDLQVTRLGNPESVSLEEGLFDNETELDIDSKTCLAVVLSYSLLDFCWEPWFPRGWTKGGISLLQYSDKLLLRPTLVTYIRRHPKGSDPFKVSSDLKLLFHAILLMEIFKQEPLSFQADHGGVVNVSDFRAKARKEFDAVRWGVSEGFRQSVDACIDGFQDKQGASEDAEEFLAADFCKAVINPLERDFISLWGNKDPDQVLSELKLPSIKRKKPPPPKPKPKPVHLKKQRNPAPPTRPKPSIPTSSTHVPIAPAIRRLQFKFFDVEDEPDPAQVQGARNWFDKFDRVCNDQPPQKWNRVKGKGIKIAVLDTGIDLSNSWISSKAGRLQCWPSERSCEDTDGHGTQVAYLLLRLAPLVQLRIAKVSKSQLLNDADIEEIAKLSTHILVDTKTADPSQAIKRFSSDDGDRVDIINLSFGFPSFHERLRPILEAILEARAKNVLVFAAAGNEGGNQGVFWPAKLPDVIRINAADCNGNAASFSPTDGAQRRICTLGEAVPSCEPDTNNNNETVHRSGTSFATPIAAAIAAIVLGFIDGADSLDLPEDFKGSEGFKGLKRRLRTRSGMESVLCKTCVLQGEEKRAGFSYIAPWFFLEIEESSRVGIITNELRHCPE